MCYISKYINTAHYLPILIFARSFLQFVILTY